MSRVNWIICERKGRWAAALRVVLSRSAWESSMIPRVYEVRQLADLAERLTSHPDNLVMIEVRPENVRDVLGWLAAAGRAYPGSRTVALVEANVFGSPLIDRSTGRPARQQLVDALFEAGAADVAVSPRQLNGVLSLARLHESSRAAEVSHLAAQSSIEEWAWASLPWQAD